MKNHRAAQLLCTTGRQLQAGASALALPRARCNLPCLPPAPAPARAAEAADRARYGPTIEKWTQAFPAEQLRMVQVGAGQGKQAASLYSQQWATTGTCACGLRHVSLDGQCWPTIAGPLVPAV